ncbi:MAG: class I SAM-dependent methyltransferase [bacterium]|nr:class I SAM-dependent methyltransferase [bacterium]
MASPLSLIPYIFSQVEGETILDVGCGEGTYGFLLSNLWFQTQAWQNNPKRRCPKLIVGLDVKRKLNRSKLIKNIYAKFVCTSAERLPFPDKSFETIICIEVIEHLKKESVQKLLGEMERVAKKQIIISTPRDPLNKRFFSNSKLGNYKNWPVPDQHKSQISIEELERRSYQSIYSPVQKKNWNIITMMRFIFFRFFSNSIIAIKYIK